MAGGSRRNADEHLAARLAAGARVADAARQAGVSERTAYKRRADPVFRQRVQELRSAMIAAAVGKLADGMDEAAAKIRELVQSKDEKVALAAATKLLELGLKGSDAVNVDERLTDLEKLTAEGAPNGPDEGETGPAHQGTRRP